MKLFKENRLGKMNMAPFSVLGSSRHSDTEREVNDYYATPPNAVTELLKYEKFYNVLEPACGEGHISKVLKQKGIDVTSSDLINRGYGKVKDFSEYTFWDGDIVTNPPYKIAKEFTSHALDIIKDGNKVAMFLKLTFLETQSRASLFESNPPKIVYVSTRRYVCGKNGIFKEKSGAVCYAWFVWIKGFKGNPIIKWINK